MEVEPAGLGPYRSRKWTVREQGPDCLREDQVREGREPVLR